MINAEGVIDDNYILLPTGDNITYEYDIVCSIDAGDKVYVQLERYDINKTTISNSGAINCIAGIQPTADLSYARYKGTITFPDLSDGNPTVYIRLRILNGNNSTTGTAIFHSISLRAITNNNIQTASAQKNGQAITDHIRELKLSNARFTKNGFIDSPQFYEY